MTDVLSTGGHVPGRFRRKSICTRRDRANVPGEGVTGTVDSDYGAGDHAVGTALASYCPHELEVVSMPAKRAPPACYPPAMPAALLALVLLAAAVDPRLDEPMRVLASPSPG